MPQDATEKARSLIEHIIGTLLHIWGRVARIGLIAGAGGALATEVVAGIVTHRFPSGTAHLAAAALGIAAAYAAAATVLVSEILLGLLHAMRVVEGDAEAGALAAAAIARQEARTAANDFSSIFGLRRPATSPAVTPATTSLPLRSSEQPQPQRPVAPARPLRNPAASLPATPVLAPDPYEAELPPQLPPLPVRADRLPRIGWASETAPTNPPINPPSDPAQTREMTLDEDVSAAPLERARASEGSGAFGFASVAALGVVGGMLEAERHQTRQSAPVVAVATPLEEPRVETPQVATPQSGTAQLVTSLDAPTMEGSALSAASASPNVSDAIPADVSMSERSDAAGYETAATIVPTLTTLTTPVPVAPSVPLTLAPLADLYDEAPLVPPLAMPSLPLAEEASMSSAPPPVEGAQEIADVSGARVSLPAPSLPDPLDGPPTMPRPGGRQTHPLAPITSPLAAPSSDPLAPPTGNGNLWDRLSQALLGVAPGSSSAGDVPARADAEDANPTEGERA